MVQKTEPVLVPEQQILYQRQQISIFQIQVLLVSEQEEMEQESEPV